ncbi:MAG: TonB-dependent receptor [Asticcacaulis sp.]
MKQKFPLRTSLRAALISSACALVFAGAALAQSASYNVPSGDLKTALNAYIRQSGTQLIYRSDDLTGKTTSGVQGQLSNVEALNRLLAGTGLNAVRNAEGALIITRNSAAATEAEEPSEVVVTAQKRTQRLIEVPLAVSVISGNELSAAQITDTTGLINAVPGLTFQQGNNPTNASFRIRGIGTSLFGQGTEASVSVVIDGVVAARQAQSFTDLVDVERVEVLRGPQGTLLGKNATAGVINVVTAAPTATLTGKITATVADHDERRLAGTISGPLTDNLRFRLSGYNALGGDYITNIHDGSKRGGTDTRGLRGKLEWFATDKLSFLLTSDYRHTYARCCEPVLINAVNPLVAQLDGTGGGKDNLSTRNNSATWSDVKANTTSLHVRYDLGFADLTSISAYQRFSIRNNFEPDRAPFDVPVWMGAPNASALFDYNRGFTAVTDWSHETRLNSKAGERLTWVAGIYYDRLNVARDFARRRATCASGTTIFEPCAANTIAWSSLSMHSDMSSESLAAFGQIEYKLTDKLNLLAGLRVQEDEITISGQRFGPMVAGDGVFGPADTVKTGQSHTGNATSGKLGLQYEFNRNAQTYASVTRGYKGAGYDTETGADFGGQRVTRPEFVTSYEVGYKARTRDGRYTIAASTFYADYTDMQVQTQAFDPVTGLSATLQTNAGTAKVKGAELEATWRPDGRFSLNGSLAYVDVKADIDGLACPLQDQLASVTTYAEGAAHPTNACYRFQYRTKAGALVTSGFVQNVRDGTLPASPHWKLSVNPRYQTQFGDDYSGFVQANINYTGKQSFSLEQDPLLRQKAYTIVNLTAGVTYRNYTLTGYVRNLFDESYFVSMSHSANFATAASPNDLYAHKARDSRRYVGLSLSTTF